VGGIVNAVSIGEIAGRGRNTGRQAGRDKNTGRDKPSPYYTDPNAV